MPDDRQVVVVPVDPQAYGLGLALGCLWQFRDAIAVLLGIIMLIAAPFVLVSEVRKAADNAQTARENPVLEQQYLREIGNAITQAFALASANAASCAISPDTGRFFTTGAQDEMKDELTRLCTKGQIAEQNVTISRISSIRFLEGGGNLLNTARKMSQVTYACAVVTTDERVTVRTKDGSIVTPLRTASDPEARVSLERAGGQWRVVEAKIGALDFEYWAYVTSYCGGGRDYNSPWPLDGASPATAPAAAVATPTRPAAPPPSTPPAASAPPATAVPPTPTRAPAAPPTAAPAAPAQTAPTATRPPAAPPTATPVPTAAPRLVRGAPADWLITRADLPSGFGVVNEASYRSEDVAPYYPNPAEVLDLFRKWGRVISTARTFQLTDGCKAPGWLRGVNSRAVLYDTAWGAHEGAVWSEGIDRQTAQIVRTSSVGEYAYNAWYNDAGACGSQRTLSLLWSRYNVVAAVDVIAAAGQISDADIEKTAIALAQKIDAKLLTAAR